jgi:hypothetical protein
LEEGSHGSNFSFSPLDLSNEKVSWAFRNQALRRKTKGKSYSRKRKQLTQRDSQKPEHNLGQGWGEDMEGGACLEKNCAANHQNEVEELLISAEFRSVTSQTLQRANLEMDKKVGEK